jgi:hypothetical protein
MATHTRRKNHIGQPFLHDGTCLVQHSEKAKALWESFKDRLGVSNFEQIHYNIDDLVPAVQLPELDYPFFDEETSMALKETLNDHAPGPDGFNVLLKKRCWNIMKEDFNRLLSQCHNGSANLAHLNGSFITLVPKIDNPRSTNDLHVHLSLKQFNETTDKDVSHQTSIIYPVSSTLKPAWIHKS